VEERVPRLCRGGCAAAEGDGRTDPTARPLESSRIAVDGTRTGTSSEKVALPMSRIEAGVAANSAAVPSTAIGLTRPGWCSDRAAASERWY
jgi:hypothetical protein